MYLTHADVRFLDLLGLQIFIGYVSTFLKCVELAGVSGVMLTLVFMATDPLLIARDNG